MNENTPINGTIQVLDEERREIWFEPADGSSRLIVQPSPFDALFLGECFARKLLITVTGQQLHNLPLVLNAKITLSQRAGGAS